MTCPKQGREMEAVVLHRVGFLAYSCPKQGQDFKHSAAPLYPNMGQVPPPRGGNAQQMNIQKIILPFVLSPFLAGYCPRTDKSSETLFTGSRRGFA